MLAIITMIGGAIVRNVQGWLTPALADGKVDAYEWRQLAATTAKVVFVAGFLHWGVDVSAEVASAVAVLADFGLSEARKIQLKKK